MFRAGDRSFAHTVQRLLITYFAARLSAEKVHKRSEIAFSLVCQAVLLTACGVGTASPNGTLPTPAAHDFGATASTPREREEETSAQNETETADETIVFEMAANVLPPGQVTLHNGIQVASSDWQTLILAKIPRPGAASDRIPTCTGTFLGPATVLMAAHCVDNPLGTSVRKAQLKVESRHVPLVCEIHPDYLDLDPRFSSPRGSEDYALCALEYGGAVPAAISGLLFEVLDAEVPPRSGASVLMTGYGCSELRIVDDELDWSRSDHLLRIGDGTIDIAASPSSPDPAYLTIRSDNGTGPAICPGDSGGPLFRSASTSAPDGERRVIGVNSAVTLERRQDGVHDIISLISATGNERFRAWAMDWADRHDAVVCGLTSNAGRSPCRD